MRGKKVCIISTAASAMRRYVIHVARALVSQGIEVSLISNWDEELAGLCKDGGIGFFPLKMKRGIDLAGPFVTLKMKRILKRGGYDLVSYSSPNAAFYASIAAKSAKIPVRMYTQWGIRYVGLSGVPRRVFKAVERRVCALSTHVRAVSQKNLAFDISEQLCSPDKVAVVGNGGTVGVDTELFDISKKNAYREKTRKKYNIPADAFVFGFCGRFSRDKGAGELLGAFRDLGNSCPGAFLLVVGEFEDLSGVDPALLDWAKANERVIFTERIPESEVCEYYPAMDLLVHPTYREGFGMVIQEAGAFGVPTLTTDIPGASEVMEDGVSCVLIPPRDKKALEDGMSRFYGDRALGERIGGEAYRRTVQLYTRPVMLKNQLDDYLNLLGES